MKRSPTSHSRGAGRSNLFHRLPNGRGAGVAANGMGPTGRKRLPRARRMALKAGD